MNRTLAPITEPVSKLRAGLKRRADRRRVVDKVTMTELEERGWTGIQPVFVLSTGRCGTMLLSSIMEAAGGVEVHHEPRPECIRVSKLAYERIADEPDLFLEVFKTAREELLHRAVRYGKTYVETNCRITFFAPVIAQMIPEAKFIHLYRHPADIVRSGIRRGWYSGAHHHDIGRIVPRPGDPAAEGWAERDGIYKNGWLWQATSDFIEEFGATMPTDRFMRVKAEDLYANPAAGQGALAFCGLPPLDVEKVRSIISRPANAQVGGVPFPKWRDWSDEQRAILREAAPRAGELGYEL